ncbi:MAG: xanthine dehydrogenase family protein subunit M [Candidatus Eremiobacteraeota bacterium]|nr:xanthine dehydrogenase family protein subunit M [Candidatus Eremiobacteraeota bacterium]
MFPAQFTYERARSEDEALAALAKYGSDARILAGGQSLIPAMRYRLARPGVLIDINPITAFEYIEERDGYLSVGATARDYAIEMSSPIRSRYQLLAATSKVIADPVVRQTGTLAGSLCHNDPAGDWPVAALAARAQIVVRGVRGTRLVSADDFLVDSFTTAVGDDEMAVEVRFPKPPPLTYGAYHKIERKVGDFATACAGVQLTFDTGGRVAAAGIAIGAVGAKALRVADGEMMMTGYVPTEELIGEVVEVAKRVADPVADNRGSVQYKREMAGVLVGRALRDACRLSGLKGEGASW